MSYNLSFSFYKVGERGTIRATSNYNPEKAVDALYFGMKGLGTDEDAIIDVVATHTFHQRQELKMLYRHKYGKDLVKELDSELSFHFSKTVLALMTIPELFILECIHQAISKSRAARLLKHLQKIYKKGLGSDEYSLLALICPRSNQELDAIKALYKKTYGNELEDDVGYDLGDDLRSLILDMISGDRECENPEHGVNLEKVLEDADNLHGATFVPVGEICGTKERVFQQIFNMRSYEHLRHLIPAYEDLVNKPMEDYIENSNLSQDLKEAYVAIVKILRSEPDFYAERLREAIAGLGTDDDTLISIVVLRSEIDLRDIMGRYISKYGVTLQEDVIGDTSGDYRHILLKILDVPEVDEEGVCMDKRPSLFPAEEEPDEVTLTAPAQDEADPEIERTLPTPMIVESLASSMEIPEEEAPIPEGKPEDTPAPAPEEIPEHSTATVEVGEEQENRNELPVTEAEETKATSDIVGEEPMGAEVDEMGVTEETEVEKEKVEDKETEGLAEKESKTAEPAENPNEEDTGVIGG